MNNTYLIYIAMILIGLTSCESDEVPLDTTPTKTLVDFLEHDLYIRGTLDGVDFEVVHQDIDSYNANLNYNATTNIHPDAFFGSSFVLDDEQSSNYYQTLYTFGISKEEDSQFEEVVKVGKYSWYDYWNDVTAEGNALASYHELGDDMFWSKMPPSEPNTEDYFEITAITPIAIDEDLLPEYEGKLYVVEGNFAIDIQSFAGARSSRLVVESFSALFYDDAE